MNMANTEFSLPLRVYIEDTDAGGIVYYINYLKYMERARTEFMRSLGFAKTAIFADDLMFVVHTSNVQYLDSARLDDEVVVTAKPVKMGKTNICFHQQVRRGTSVLCRADIRIACVDQKNRKPRAMPVSMQQTIQSFITVPEE